MGKAERIVQVYEAVAAEYERLLGEHGFAVSLHRVADPDCGQHTVWLAHRAAAHDAAE